MIGYHAKTLGIEIGQREMTDFAFVLQVREMFERVEVILVVVIPSMELEQVETFHAHARERVANRTLNEWSGHPARNRDPLGEPGPTW
jgi:hypothetical protein